jgi:pimeloyl-ACP methyl ester carboxylesterase
MENKLLFLPGLLNDAGLFQEQITALSTLATVAVADLTRSNSIAGLAEDALSQAPEGKFVLIGLSMGGYVAFEIMRRAPERVCGLVLLDTSARPDTAEATEVRLKLMKLAETNFAEVTESLLARLSYPERMKLPAVRGVIQSMATSLGKEVFFRQQQAIIGRPDSRPTLANIDCPTLIICGREDLITPPEIAEEMADGIKYAELKIIEECGHLSTLDRPEEVSKLLVDWVGSLSLKQSELAL